MPTTRPTLANLVMGAPHEQLKIAMVVWLVRGGGRNILFDSGFHRDTFLKHFHTVTTFAPTKPSNSRGLQPEESRTS